VLPIDINARAAAAGGGGGDGAAAQLDMDDGAADGEWVKGLVRFNAVFPCLTLSTLGMYIR
jgi:hypothetical protein